MANYLAKITELQHQHARDLEESAKLRAELATARQRIAELERDADASHEAIVLAKGFAEGWNPLVKRAESAEARVKELERREARSLEQFASLANKRDAAEAKLTKLHASVLADQTKAQKYMARLESELLQLRTALAIANKTTEEENRT